MPHHDKCIFQRLRESVTGRQFYMSVVNLCMHRYVSCVEASGVRVLLLFSLYAEAVLY